MKRRLTTLALALSVGLASCHADGITSSDRGFTLEASISDASIGPGETATVTYRLRNESPLPRTVTVGCGMLPYVTDDNGAIIYPGGGTWVCTMELRPPITVAPGEEITRTLQVSGEAASAPGGPRIKLPPGRYAVYVDFWAALPDVRKEVRLRSGNVPFEITAGGG